jgi:hypothetical protein
VRSGTPSAILAQPDLDEHQAGGGDESEVDQHQRENLSGAAAERRRAHRAGRDQQAGAPKSADPWGACFTTPRSSAYAEREQLPTPEDQHILREAISAGYTRFTAAPNTLTDFGRTPSHLDRCTGKKTVQTGIGVPRRPR